MNRLKSGLACVLLGGSLGLLSAVIVLLGWQLKFGQSAGSAASYLNASQLLLFSVLNGALLGCLSRLISEAFGFLESNLLSVLLSLALGAAYILASGIGFEALAPLAVYAASVANGILVVSAARGLVQYLSERRYAETAWEN